MEQWVYAMTILPDVLDEDKRLADLVRNFSLGLEGTQELIKEGNINISEKEKILITLAGQIHQRINKLLYETFD
jgi:hypothetical protein